MCPSCTIIKQSSELVELKDLVKNLSNELAAMKALQQRVINLEQQLSSVKEPASTSVSDSTTNPSNSQSNKSTADDHISTIVSSYMNEEKEKARRRLNIIVHNLEESSYEDGAT